MPTAENRGVEEEVRKLRKQMQYPQANTSINLSKERQEHSFSSSLSVFSPFTYVLFALAIKCLNENLLQGTGYWFATLHIWKTWTKKNVHSLN